MTKKKKWINALIFIGGLIVFLFYYFEDNADMEKVEKEQDQSAEKSGGIMIEDLNASFNDDPIKRDSVVMDSL